MRMPPQSLIRFTVMGRSSLPLQIVGFTPLHAGGRGRVRASYQQTNYTDKGFNCQRERERERERERRRRNNNERGARANFCGSIIVVMASQSQSQFSLPPPSHSSLRSGDLRIDGCLNSSSRPELLRFNCGHFHFRHNLRNSSSHRSRCREPQPRKD